MPHNDLSKPFSGFCVARDDLRRWHWEERSAADTSKLRQGEITVEIDKFAFTANNVTYARLGIKSPIGGSSRRPKAGATFRFGVSATSFAPFSRR
ncbi:MAG: hypothetical protein ACLPKB_00370 [Xanthobacteraceae bacterium]